MGGLLIQHVDINGIEGFGVVLGNAPIQRFSGDAYFEVTVEQLRPGVARDGLVLGVSIDPWMPSSEYLEAADGLENSWSLGYDGSCRWPDDHYEEIEWSPASLCKG